MVRGSVEFFSRIVTRFCVCVFHIRITSSFPTPTIFVNTLGVFTNIGNPRCVSHLTFIVCNMFFHEIITRAYTSNNVSFVNFQFLHSSVSGSTLHIKAMGHKNKAFRGFSALGKHRVNGYTRVSDQAKGTIYVSPRAICRSGRVKEAISGGFIKEVVLSTNKVVTRGCTKGYAGHFQCVVRVFLHGLLTYSSESEHVYIGLFFFHPNYNGSRLVGYMRERVNDICEGGTTRNDY